MIKFAKIDQSNSVITRLKEAKEASDSRDYEKKTRIIRELMKESPGDWDIDSEDKGIAGITHTPTSFRFHLPSQRVVQEIRNQKRADLFENLLNPIPTANDPDPWRTRIDAIFNYDNGSALMGALAGGTIGGLSHLLPSDKKKPKMSVWKKILAGTAIGGVGGYGLAKAMPELSEKANRAVLDNVVSPAVGRVATNLVDPYSYTIEGRLDNIYDPKRPLISSLNSLEHIIKDDNVMSSDRDHLWRYMWNLPSRSLSANDGSKTVIYDKILGGGKDDYKIPEDSVESIQSEMSSTFDNVIRGNDTTGLFGDKYKEPNAKAKAYMENDGMSATDAYLKAIKEYYKKNSPNSIVLGRFAPKFDINDKGDIIAKVKDPWDINLNSDDFITRNDKKDHYGINSQPIVMKSNINLTNAFRHIVTKLTGGRGMHLKADINLGNIRDKVTALQPSDMSKYPSTGDLLAQR